MRSSGGTSTDWIWITADGAWSDKPRWSHDGRLIYYLSQQGGPFNVWAVEFDSSAGRVVGEPFRMTPFGATGEQIAPDLVNLDLAVGGRQLAIPVINPIGSIWMLENVARCCARPAREGDMHELPRVATRLRFGPFTLDLRWTNWPAPNRRWQS